MYTAAGGETFAHLRSRPASFSSAAAAALGRKDKAHARLPWVLTTAACCGARGGL